MAVTKFTQEFKVRVSAKRMFKALTTESQTIIPKVNPDVKSIEIVQGDGRAGTIRKVNFPDGAPFAYMKHRIDAIDAENLVNKFTLFEGPVLEDKLESVIYVQKFEDSSDGGCIIKVACEYHTKGDIQLKEEEIKAGKDQDPVFYAVVEEYLLAHPGVCA